MTTEEVSLPLASKGGGSSNSSSTAPQPMWGGEHSQPLQPLQPLCDLLEPLESVNPAKSRWQVLLKDFLWTTDSKWLEKQIVDPSAWAIAMAKSKGLTVIGPIYNNSHICIIDNRLNIIRNQVL
jgi:hypothetical protein